MNLVDFLIVAFLVVLVVLAIRTLGKNKCTCTCDKCHKSCKSKSDVGR